MHIKPKSIKSVNYKNLNELINKLNKYSVYREPKYILLFDYINSPVCEDSNSFTIFQYYQQHNNNDAYYVLNSKTELYSSLLKQNKTKNIIPYYNFRSNKHLFHYILNSKIIIQSYALHFFQTIVSRVKYLKFLYICHAVNYFKTSIIKDNQIRFNTDLVLAEDLYFCCEYLLHCSKVSYDPKPVYHYVVQENSQINSNRYGAPYNPKSLNIITTYTRLQSLIPAKYQKVHQSINTQLCWSSTTILRNIMLAPNRDEVPADTIAKLKGIVKQNRHDFMQNTILPKRDKIIFMLNLYAPGLLAWIWKKFSLRGNGF